MKITPESMWWVPIQYQKNWVVKNLQLHIPLVLILTIREELIMQLVLDSIKINLLKK